MRTVWCVVLVIVAAGRLGGQPAPVTMPLLAELAVGMGPGQIEFSDNLYTGTSPSTLAFADGRTLWIGEVGEAEAFDVHLGKILQVIPYPADPKGDIQNGNNELFLPERLFLTNGGLVIRSRVTRQPLSVGSPVVYDNPQTYSSLHAVREHVFFFGRDRLVHCIDPGGALLSNSATVALLRGWLSATWYPSAELRSVHARLIDTGRFVIADGIYYPATGDQMYEYFRVRRTRWDFGSLVSEGRTPSPPKGLSMTGDIYLFWDDFQVIGQDGVTVATINVDETVLPRSDPKYAPDRPEYYNVSSTLFTVHPNGDLYSLYAIKDEVARIHRAAKTWGTDLIAMAHAGTPAGRESETRERVRGLSIMEVRILRNALFALHGYAFKTFDLAMYFGGYDWYEPDPDVTSDASMLTPDQKRLLDIATAIEAERVVRQ